jgi:uncharacterized C2H2 Zn-finger protein
MALFRCPDCDERMTDSGDRVARHITKHLEDLVARGELVKNEDGSYSLAEEGTE